MTRLARLSIRHPVAALIVFAAVTGLLAVLGIGVEDRLQTTTLTIPGTESSRAVKLYREEFGESVTVPILVRGPEAQVDRQGPQLVAALRDEPRVRVLSPWGAGGDESPLRPEPNAALVIAALDVGVEEAVEVVEPKVRAIVERELSEPVDGHVSGLATIGRALKEKTFSAARSAERIALPALLLVLLLVFRSPIAAAIPALLGFAVVRASAGGLELLTGAFSIEVIAVSLASMMGLALGVDYSLLIVSRFRENLREGGSAAEAAEAAAGTAGRTALFAGVALVAAMAVAMALSPGDLLVSAGLGVVVAAVLSICASFVATPAMLALLGTNVDRWHIGSPAGTPSWAGLAAGVMRRPLMAALPILLLLLLLGAPSLALETGAPDVRQLPQGTQAREDFEQIRDTMGPGWAQPFEVVAVAPQGTITTQDRLERIERWQGRVARFENVDAVLGPARMAGRAKRLRRIEPQLRQARKGLRRGDRRLTRLRDGLEEAVDGVRELRNGLAQAAAGAAAIATGTDDARRGAERLAAGLARASASADRIDSGLARATGAARALARGSRRLAAGAEQLREGNARARDQVQASIPAARALEEGLREGSEDLGRLREPAGTTEAELGEALDALRGMTIGAADPRYAEALESVSRAYGAATGRDPVTGTRIAPDYPGLEQSIAQAQAGTAAAAAAAGALADGSERLADGLGRLADGAAELASGAGRLRRGAAQLTDGLERLERGGGALTFGLDRLSQGAAALADGVARLDSGSERLASELSASRRESAPLESGLARAASGVGRFQRMADLRMSARQIGRFQRRTPGFFDSGHFFLAALDGLPPEDEVRARFAVNVEGGGEAARILIVPKTGPNDEETAPLRDRLSTEADRLAEMTRTDTALGGQGGLLADYDRITSERLLPLVIALSVVTFLVLIPIFRALVLPAIGVLLNLVTVGAAFGVLVLAFQGVDPLLGGPGFINAIAVNAIFTVVFALSIDYQVFLIARMREGWERTGDTQEALRYGIERTGGVITGAAAIMAAVFIAFSFTDVASTRQFGVGLATAVLIDATIVRLVLLPAAITLVGDRTWWLPAWLDRLLPNVNVEGGDGPARRPAVSTLGDRSGG